MSLLPVAEAQARLLALATPLTIEPTPLVAATGRIAAEGVFARRTQPAADLSAMDGYALRFADLPGPLRLIGESKAGGGFDRALGPGEAARIFTGAPVPEGADTILIQEEAARDGDLVRLAGEGPPGPGAHVRRRGSDFCEGDRLLAAGDRLSPARIALAAMAAHGSVPVRRAARVTIISTGDELVPPGAATPGVSLPASNAPMLAALLSGCAAQVRDAGILPDRLDVLTEGLARAAGEADILVTTGGVSVGDHDLVRPALEQAGATLDFWRVAMRPGKPLMAGRLGETVLLGLPGNPVSAFVTAQLFLLPLIAHLAGEADPLPRRTRVPLGAGGLPRVGLREDFVRARLVDGQAVPLTRQDSAVLAALAEADILIVRPAGAPAAAVGDAVDILRIA